MHGTVYDEPSNALYCKHINDKKVPIYEVPEFLRYETKRRIRRLVEDVLLPSLALINLLRNTGFLPQVKEIQLFYTYPNNYCLRRFNGATLPRSLKWAVLSHESHPYETLTDNTLQTSDTFSLRFETKRDNYKADPEYIDFDEDRRTRSLKFMRNVSSDGTISFSYRYSCPVALTHGMPCLHMKRFAAVYADYSR